MGSLVSVLMGSNGCSNGCCSGCSDGCSNRCCRVIIRVSRGSLVGVLMDVVGINSG